MKTHLGRTVIRKSEMKAIGGFAKLLETKHIEMSAAEEALVNEYLQGRLTKEALQEALMALPMED